ncbi:hypothetical protein BT67DRAFT_86465 [Trichocladium antarcticum]|uniref:Uncharacterized protein n=1 Tax=Trichocladium antarcticum TaxID=1450529 RepID=A0AAN6UG32_9PEZI|nr:hypothetical protein BT67DRAFT_86465 [Trichocladium antarcticum]
MAPLMSVERAHRSYGPVDKQALSGRMSKSERGLLRMGLVKSAQWKQLPTEGLYQVAISEVLDGGTMRALERGGGRALAVTAVLDLGLRMVESDRGRDALERLAHKAICVWRERPVLAPTYETSDVDIPAAVDEFLRCVRYRFPLVRLDDRNGFCHEEGSCAAFYSWADEFSSLEPSKFNPKEAAVLHLNWQLVDKLYWTRLKADVARRHCRDDDHVAQTARFHRLQFHLAAMVTHHLCHLFVNFLRQCDALAGQVTDADFMRLVRRYDPGAEFEIDFFGGRPKLFIDHGGPAAAADSYPGQSYVIRRGGDSGRMAAAVAQYKIESYLQGDFSVPLLTEVEGEVFPMERYQEVKRRYGVARQGPCQWREGRTGTRRVAEMGSADPPLSVPWNIQGSEYQRMKRACFDPAVRIVDSGGY